MNAAVPAHFGNRLLANIVEITLPEPISWWPRAPGWQALAVVLLALALVWISRAVLRWRRNAYRRAALRQLAELETRDAIAELPILLKSVALAAYPRAAVASLAGAEWLRFLDAQCPQSRFADGGGNALIAVAYQSRAEWHFSETEIQALFAATRYWIRAHPGHADA